VRIFNLLYRNWITRRAWGKIEETVDLLD